MALDQLLKSVKWIDEQIHRQYEKLGSKLDKKSPKARYYVATGFNLGGRPFVFGLSSFVGGFVFGIDMGLNLCGCFDLLNSQKDISDTKIKENPVIEFYLKTIKVVRSPLFIGGVGCVGKGLYELVNGFAKNEPVSGESYEILLNGLGMISLSSSMFLKDRNPKLLKKEPFWKKAYNWTKEKIDSLIPQPILQPILIQSRTLENYI